MQIPFAHGCLRSWRMEDVPALAASANNRNVSITLRDAFPHPYTLADAAHYLERAIAQEPAVAFCIEVEGELAGGIGLQRREDVYRHTAEFGYWLAEPHWGRGIMSAAVQAFVQHAFASFPLERIEASVYESNPASARVLEKAGFQFEGRLRRNVTKAGQMLDSLLYAKLRDE